MDMVIEKFNYFYSYYVALKGMKAPVRLAIRDAIDEYMFEGKEPEFKDPITVSLWTLLFPNIKKTKTLALNKIGKTKEEQTDNKSKTNEKQIENKSASTAEQIRQPLFPIKDKGERKKDIGEKKDKEKSASASSPPRFHKPTVDEVRAYIQENDYHVNPNDFVNFYESKGWLVGKSPMKDWKAAVRTWESKEKNENPAKFAEEKEDEYHPIVPLDRCHVCESKNVSTHGLYSQCNACGVTYVWNSKKGEWREEC